MAGFVQRFGTDECGAVTVDWVVVAAMLLAIGIVMVRETSEGAGVMAGNLRNQLRADLPRIESAP